MNHRIRHLLCGHLDARVEDYGDESFRWQLRCRTCGNSEEWSQAEWRRFLKPAAPVVGSKAGSELLTVADEPLEL
jgi:hypothetical protein